MLEIDMENLNISEIFTLLIGLGLLFIILGSLFYFLYLKPKREREKQALLQAEKENTKKKEVDERIKKNQKYWKEVAEYMNIIDKINNDEK